uniref:Central tail fiber J n=1 Tax=Pseudomonas phage PACT201 TaxID=3230130 RepID=A0AAU8GV20_9VIRU
MQFYVKNVTRPSWEQFQLEVIQHEPGKFDAIDHGAIIDSRPISVLPSGVQDPPARVLIFAAHRGRARPGASRS